ncbi:hypothetical protein Tco_1474147 [Tanacetum coccineum]
MRRNWNFWQTRLVTQTVITHNATYQSDDLDVYDSDCDDFSTAKAVLMANLSSYRSDVLSEVPHSKNTHNDMLNQTVQDTYSSTQQDAMILSMLEQLSNQVTNCNKVNKDNLIANESLSTKLERYKEWVKLLEEKQNIDLSTRKKLIMDDIIQEKNAQFADFEKEINYLKQTLSEQSNEKELLTKTFNVFKNESKEKEAKNIDKEISLEKKVKELDNIKAQQIRPMLYNGSVIAKEINVISIVDSKETLMLEEESRSKMLLKQNFSKRFVLQQELSGEQAFRLQSPYPNIDQSASLSIKIEAPQKLSKCEKDIDKIETINIELEHRVAKLIVENEHLKQTYKQLYDSIKPSHVRAKEHDESLVNQLNQKKFKGKDIVDNVAQVSNVTTIAPGMYKLDPVVPDIH